MGKNTAETVPKSNRKILERGKIDTPNMQIHDLSLTFLAWYRQFNIRKVAVLN